MELWTALVLGLFGGLHCAGMCGPLALALPAGGSGVRFVLGRLAYNLGRVVTYCVLGLIFGVVGRSFALAGVQRWVSIALGAVLLTGLFASHSLGTSLPIIKFVQWIKSRMSGLFRQRSLAALAALGLLNGLLPCGLVYVAAAGATATGSIVGGLGYMALFGLGTLPVMLAISLSGSLIPAAVRLKLLRAVPVSVFVLGALLILRGLSLGVPYLSPDLSSGNCCH